MWSRLILAVLLLAPGPLLARDVMVGIGLSISPYVIPDELRGMEFDIAKEALALEGLEMKPLFMPLGRVLKSMDKGQVEAALTQRPGNDPKALYSDVYITYHNVAISLAARDLKIDRLEDLRGKSVLAFQNATNYLGPDFKAAVEAKADYREEATQVVQPLLLYLHRVDVVIADRNIFNWFAGLPEVKAKADTSQPIRLHPLFAPSDYRMAFRNPELRDSFNRGLAKLKASGEYARIVARYSPLMVEEKR